MAQKVEWPIGGSIHGSSRPCQFLVKTLDPKLLTKAVPPVCDGYRRLVSPNEQVALYVVAPTISV